MSEPIYILGGYQTDFARVWSREGLDISDMIREASLGALAESGIEPSHIDSIHVGNAFAEAQRQQGHLGAMVSQVVPELWGKPAMRHEGACASSSLATLTAMAEIEAGRYDCVLVVGAEEFKNLPGDQASENQNSAAWRNRENIDCRFMWPAVFGLLADEYEERYGLNRELLNQISDINYTNAKRNPLAQTRQWQFAEGSFSEDDALNPVIEPGVRRLHCGQITDGACALVLASGSFLKKHRMQSGKKALARIEGWGHRNAGIRYRDKVERSKNQPYVFPHVRDAITDAFGRAGIQDVYQLDGIETHDCFSMTEYMAIDHLGMTPPGESWRAVENGTIAPGGRLPVNPSGGLIGCGHPVGATGARMLLDASRQVTASAGEMQIEGAGRVATLNIGGSCATVCSFIVGRE
ncbi:MAG: thiolase domain-containing protein [Luminiphilus sp.]|jgi:acetyl-CoA C-acetyltransferase|nr:thiolase domain-containing protein [Luminiphilus sp.]MDA0631079.1 acetyl-CoA acetyltransferase [Pseudomonadota bacterium]